MICNCSLLYIMYSGDFKFHSIWKTLIYSKSFLFENLLDRRSSFYWNCDPFGMKVLASMILALSVSSMKNAISSERQFGQAAALAWLELFHWSMQFEWKMWLQWVWIRSPTAVWFLRQGWIQIEQSIFIKSVFLWRLMVEKSSGFRFYMNTLAFQKYELLFEFKTLADYSSKLFMMKSILYNLIYIYLVGTEACKL